MPETQQLIKKDMTVSDVILKYPFAADIMESYGLTCTGCSVNTMESVELGARGHGMADDKIDTMVQDINDVIISGKSAPAPEPQAKVEPMVVTDKAVEKMKSILKDQGKEGSP